MAETCLQTRLSKRWERGTAWWFGGRYLEKAWRSCNTLAVARCGAAVVSGWACFHLQSQNGEKPSCCFLVHLLIHERLFGSAGWWVMQDATRVERSSWLFSCTELYCAGGKASWPQKHHFKFCVSPCIVSVFGFSGHLFMLSSSSVSLLCFFHTGPLRIFFSPPPPQSRVLSSALQRFAVALCTCPCGAPISLFFLLGLCVVWLLQFTTE